MDISANALQDHFSRLSPPWQAAFTQAWESFSAGDLGIGAVVVDPAGAVVSTGRTRRRDTSRAPGQVTGGNLAHAEINALVGLPAGSYDDHTMLTTLEPCLLCTGALRLNHIGTVEYAAPDPVWRGIERLPELNRHVARRWTRRVGPIEPPLRDWATLLPLTHYPEHGVRGLVVDDYRTAYPELMAVAEDLVGGGYLPRLRALSLPAAFALVADVAAP